MKINQLRFKNLNSLAGEWSIDFTSPEYVGDGIFAISGPTGAGKSTILDAICLALYGRTPRLDNISASTNEIMSKQTGECFAEVVFETPEGFFRAHWSQKRARGRPGGALQQPKHEISEAGEEGKLFASQLRQTATVVEEKTGMDFNRFTQSMMLAQGGFAAFLKASGNDRAPVLEQITGTEIYSRISVHVFQQNKAEKEKLERLKAESSGIILMGPEEEEQIRSEIEEKNRTKMVIAEKIEKLDTAIKWLKKIKDIKQDLQDITDRESIIEKSIEESGPDRERLKNALRALNLEGDYSGLKSVKGQQEADIEALRSFQNKLPALHAEKEKAIAAFAVAEKKYNDSKSAKESLLKLTRDVRLIDQDITQKDSAFKTIAENIKNLEAERKNEGKKKSAIEKSILALKTELEEIYNYRKINPTDSILVTGFTGIESTFERLTEADRSVSEAEEKVNSAKKSLKDISEKVKEADSRLQAVVRKNAGELEEIKGIKAGIEELLEGKTLEEVIKRKDELILRLAELTQIADYETARSKLEDGKPCPLCGSPDHPYARGNVPVATGTEKELKNILELLEKHNKLIKKLEKLTTDERRSAEKMASEKSQYDLLNQRKEEFEKRAEDRAKEYEKACSAFNKITGALKQTLLPLGITEIPSEIEEIEKLQSSLKARRDKWNTDEYRKDEINPILQEKQKELAVLNNSLNTIDRDLEARKKEYESLRTSMVALRTHRKELFGDLMPDEEEKNASEKVTEAEKEKQNADETIKQKDNQLTSIKARISGLEESIAKRKESLAKAQQDFAIRLTENGFESEESFLQARMNPDERRKLDEKINDLDRKKLELAAEKKAKAEELEKEQMKKLTEDSPEVLSERYTEALRENESLLQEIGMRTGKLSANEEAKTRGREIAGKIADQVLVCERWSKLSSLIGSADGKKYRNFAQGLTLEIMVAHANSQLAKLSDRYLLIRDKEEPLELNVMDNYQAGEIRSTKNLSGGESFIVSLALALGLSRMASRKVSVDSLFLDEGFGTLDEETLETALGTLASLRQEGKIIGVISHVGAMKERINTKIIVQPVREGRSILSGPGCRALG